MAPGYNAFDTEPPSPCVSQMTLSVQAHRLALSLESAVLCVFLSAACWEGFGLQAEAWGCDASAGDACYAFATGAGSASGIVVGTALTCAWRLMHQSSGPQAYDVAASVCLISAFTAFWVGTAWWPLVASLKDTGLVFNAVFLLTGLCQLPTIWRAHLTSPLPPLCLTPRPMHTPASPLPLLLPPPPSLPLPN